MKKLVNFKNTEAINLSEFLKDYSRPTEDECIIAKPEETQKNYVFVSFDLCNSTELKHKSIYWFDIISAFLGSHRYLTQMNCWKFNGDEILYYAEINSVFDIIDLLEEAHAFIEYSKNLLINTVKKIAQSKNDTHINSELSLLDVRGTMWLAQTNDISFKDESILNYRFLLNKNIDFSGINIDEGFRLRNWSSKHKLVVDPKITTVLFLTNEYLQKHKLPSLIPSDKLKNFIEQASCFDSHKEINRIKDTIDKFKILGYQPCKGVWNGHLYPIIWYAEDWGDVVTNLSYDEKFDGEYVVNILENFSSKVESNKIYQLDFLIEVLAQVKEIDTVVNILEQIRFENIRGTESTNTKVLNSTTNLYYMVVCTNPISGNALMFKRSVHRKHLKGVWDFGNIKHISNKDMSMEKIISMQYRSAFGIDIQVLGDKNREGAPIYPLALCTVHRYGKMHNGILCVAQIQGNKTDDQILHLVNEKIEKTKKEFPEAYQYDEIVFVNEESFNDLKFSELTIQQIEEDSFMAESGTTKNFSENGQNMCINNCRDSIIKAIDFIKSGD